MIGLVGAVLIFGNKDALVDALRSSDRQNGGQLTDAQIDQAVNVGMIVAVVIAVVIALLYLLFACQAARRAQLGAGWSHTVITVLQLISLLVGQSTVLGYISVLAAVVGVVLSFTAPSNKFIDGAKTVRLTMRRYRHLLRAPLDLWAAVRIVGAPWHDGRRACRLLLGPAFRARLTEVLENVDPWDDQERAHLDAAVEWIASGAPLCRTRKPDVPPMHLVGYFVVLDEVRGEVLLVAHRKAGLWLPSGGHVEPGRGPVGHGAAGVRRGTAHGGRSVGGVRAGSRSS